MLKQVINPLHGHLEYFDDTRVLVVKRAIDVDSCWSGNTMHWDILHDVVATLLHNKRRVRHNFWRRGMSNERFVYTSSSLVQCEWRQRHSEFVVMLEWSFHCISRRQALKDVGSLSGNSRPIMSPSSGALNVS